MRNRKRAKGKEVAVKSLDAWMCINFDASSPREVKTWWKETLDTRMTNPLRLSSDIVIERMLLVKTEGESSFFRFKDDSKRPEERREQLFLLPSPSISCDFDLMSTSVDERWCGKKRQSELMKIRHAWWQRNDSPKVDRYRGGKRRRRTCLPSGFSDPGLYRNHCKWGRWRGGARWGRKVSSYQASSIKL